MAGAGGGTDGQAATPQAAPPVVGSVGRRVIDARHFIAAVRFLDLFEPVFDHIACRTAVVEAAHRDGSGVTTEDLQAESDAYRRVQGLHRSQAFNAWLATIGYSLDEFEEEMEFRLLCQRKRDAFSSKDVEACFREERSDFDRVRISQIVVAEEGLAREIAHQVNSEKKDFHKLASQHSLDEATRDVGGMVGWVRRRDLAPELAARVFAAPPGRVVAPDKLAEGSFQVVLVHESCAASLDAATDEEVRDLLLARWLGQRVHEVGSATKPG
jgi:peptidylprolyl isomerase